MANTKITTNVIADDAITSAKIADDAINSEHYTDGSIDTAHIADDQVTLAKMAGLARGKIIYGDSSGNPAALAPGSNGQILKSDGTDIAWGTDSSGVALDDISTGDAASTLATSAGNITIDAQGSDTDIIFKGTDGSSDITALTLDMSDAGKATFNGGIVSTQPNAFGACSFNEADLTDVGTVFADQYLGDADTDTGIVFQGSNVMTLHTNNTERMRFHASGNVSLACANDYKTLTVGDTDAEAWITAGGANTHLTVSAVGSSGAVIFKTGSTNSDPSDAIERMRINSSGNVGINNTECSHKLHVEENGTGAITSLRLANENTSVGDGSQILFTSGTSTVGAAIAGYGTALNQAALIFKAGGDTERMRIESDGDVSIHGTFGTNSSTVFASMGGRLQFDTDYSDAPRGPNKIVLQSDGNWIAGLGVSNNSTDIYTGGELNFFKTTNNTNFTRYGKVTADGEFLINDTAVRGTIQRGQLQVTQISNSNAAGISCISGNDEIAGTFCLYSSGTASAMVSVDPDEGRANSAFYIHIDNAQKAVLDSGGNFTITGSYGSSDRALKENITTLPSQLENVKKLNPVSFDWKEKAEDGSTESSIGFVAQEVEALYPNLIKTPPTDSDAEEASTTQYKSLNYAVMTAILTKALQEADAKIDALTARIETLEG